MPRGWVQGLQSTWQLSWSTWLLRSLSWLAMLPGTTRSLALSQGTFSWPLGWFNSFLFHCSDVSYLGMMKNWTSSWLVWQLPKVVSCPTSRLSSCPRRAQVPRKRLNLSNSLIFTSLLKYTMLSKSHCLNYCLVGLGFWISSIGNMECWVKTGPNLILGSRVVRSGGTNWCYKLGHQVIHCGE